MPSAEPDRPKAAWSGDKKLGAAQQAARRTAQLEAHGRAIIALAALVGRQSGASGPEVLRRLIGPEETLTVLDSVGYGARELAERWQADAPRQQAADEFRRHPEAEEALRTGGPWAQRAKVRELAEAEQAARAPEKPADYDPRVMWRTRSGVVADGRAPVAPVQQSVVHADVPELGA
jgi:hypothetical protein